MEQSIGPETKLKASIVEGKIRLQADYDGKQVDAGAYIASDVDSLVDALAELIPGDSALEKSIFGLVKVALKAVVV